MLALWAMVGVVAAIVAQTIVGQTKRDHEPRAVKLLVQPVIHLPSLSLHACRYVTVQRLGEVSSYEICEMCSRPPPTSIPGPPQSVRK